MLKKFLFGMMAATMLLATSCTDEPLVGGDEATVSFSISTPEIATRAYYSDGMTANELHYAIYDNGVLLGSLTGTKTISQGKANIQLQLKSGKTYKAIFWADNDEAPYTIDWTNKTMTIDYDNVASNNEKLDAFYACIDVEVKGNNTETVNLRRPFAQLNIGTNDLDAAETAGYTAEKTWVRVPVYNTLNLWDGTVNYNGANTPTETIFALANIPSNETFPVSGYDYLAMNYILVGNTQELVDVEFGLEDGVTERKIGSVPVRRNYRTNIYGSLLTSTTDFNIEIIPNYEQPNPDLEKWNGTELVEPAYDEATKTYSVATGSQLAWIAALVNGTLDTDNVTRTAVAKNSLKGYTVKLVADINLNDQEWTPIGYGSNHFQGTLDGNGSTIYGLKVTQRRDSRAALFGTVSGTVTFRNLTFKGANIICPDFNGDFYGSALIGTAYGNVTIENVNVIDSYISGNNKVGALLAHDGVVSSLNINNCSVSTTTFEALNPDDGGSVGGLVGYFQGVAKGTQAAPYGVHVIANSTVKDCTFNVVNSTNTGKRANGQLIGGIDSKAGQELYINNCSVINNTWNEKFYVNGTEKTSDTYESPYGGLIGGERNDQQEGEVWIDGLQLVIVDSKTLKGVGIDSQDNYVVTANEGLASLSVLIAKDDNNFKDKTILLNTDIDLSLIAPQTRSNTETTKIGDSDAPIGSTGERDGKGRLICEPFKGTFDGNGKTIKNLYQSGWDMGYEWGLYGSLGLFAELEDATVKNLTIENMEAQVEGGDISFIAGSATGNCVFENITIKNSRIGTYNNGCGGIIGWSGAGNYTFKNIELESDVVLGGLWGSFDSSIGGIVGQAEPGATYNFENVTINCRIDAYNDCTASYDYYNYRMCGMIIGRCEETTTIDGRNYPDLSKYNMAFNNVTVNYGTWMYYHYCEPTPGLNGGRGMRVEPGFAYGGLPADFDHTQCVDNHYNCIPFDQLIGGDQIAVKGLPAVDGVTVNYPAEYTCPLCGQKHGK